MRYHKFIFLLLLIIPLNFARADAVIVGGHRPDLQEQLGNFMTSGVIGTGLTGALSFGVPNVRNGQLASGYQGDDGYAIWDFGTPPTGNYTIKDILLTNVNGSSVQDIAGFWCNGDETVDNVWAFFVPIGTQDTSVDFTVDFKCTNNIMIQSFNGIIYGINIQYVLDDSMTSSINIDTINYDQSTGQIHAPFLDVLYIFILIFLCLYVIFYTIKHEKNKK